MGWAYSSFTCARSRAGNVAHPAQSEMVPTFLGLSSGVSAQAGGRRAQMPFHVEHPSFTQQPPCTCLRPPLPRTSPHLGRQVLNRRDASTGARQKRQHTGRQAPPDELPTSSSPEGESQQAAFSTAKPRVISSDPPGHRAGTLPALNTAVSRLAAAEDWRPV
jgi:hypothetical protein